MVQKKRILLATALFFLFAVAVSAQSTVKEIGRAGKVLQSLLSNQGVVYMLTIVFFFVLFYSIWGSLLKHVHLFEGEGGLGLNKLGSIAALSLSGITTTGIFAFRKFGAGAKGIVSQFGTIGGLILAVIAFLLVAKFFRQDRPLGIGGFWWGVLAFAIAAFLLGGWIGSQELATWGIILIILWILMSIIGYGIRAGRSFGSREASQEAHADQRAARQVTRGQNQAHGQLAQQQQALGQAIQGLQGLGLTNEQIRQLLSGLGRP